MRDKFQVEAAEFIRLREDQFRRLEMLGRYPRIRVRGAAGTGKTVIALEKARHLARNNFNVLFLCSSAPLARWLKGMMDEEPKEIQSRIIVRDVEHLCTDLSGQAKLLLNDPTDDELQQREELGDRSYQNKLASDVRRSVEKLEGTGELQLFDAILVDEAQDIEKPLWGPLYKLLRDKRNGKFIAFYDPAQREADDDWSPPIPGGAVELLPLSENCRNTQAVFEVAKHFYLGDPPLPACIGPAGEPVAWVDPMLSMANNTTPSEERDAITLERVLDDLIETERLSPHDILVVVGRSQKASTLYKRRSLGQHLLNNNTGIRDPNFVRITTVRSVKGLESPVVILAELDGIQSVRASKPRTYSRYMYIATSRAIHHLIVLSTSEKTLPLQESLWATQI